MATNSEFAALHGKSNDTTGAVVLKYWPIIVACAVTLVSLGGIFVKLDYIAKAIDRNDMQFVQINNQQNLTGQTLVEMRGQITQVTSANVRTEQNLTELKAKVETLYDKARWAPGSERR